MQDPQPDHETQEPQKPNPTRRGGGPKTLEGKNKSRCNALKHGLTATLLTLPDENAEDIQAHVDLWLNSCQPETAVEASTVSQAAVAMLQLNRFHKAQQAITADQTRYAASHWDQERKTRLDMALIRLANDPRSAIRELKSFGLGVRWLLKRWRELRAIFQQHGCWNNFGLILDAVRLSGFNPTKLKSEPIEAFEIAIIAVYAWPEPRDKSAIHELEEMMPPEFLGIHGGAAALDRTVAQAGLGTIIKGQILELEMLHAEFQPLDEQSRAEAHLRALAPADTPRNKLLLRYQTASSSVLNRTTKMLEALKAAREKAEAKTAPENGLSEPSEAGLRNELTGAAVPSQPSVPITNYVRIEGRLHGFDRSGDGRWTMSERDGVYPDAVITDVLPFRMAPKPGS